MMHVNEEETLRARRQPTEGSALARTSLPAAPQTRRLHQAVKVLGGKWVRLGVFFLACFFTSPLYYGWQQYSLMLGRNGAYAWLCDESWDFERQGMCDAQENSVGNLYSLAAGMEYASAAWAGVFLDHIGPRYAGMIGEVTWVLGVLMIAYSTQSVQMYIPGMLIMGASINTVCFPSLVTIETFPKWRGLMVGFMLGSSTAATAIPPVLWEMWNRNLHWKFSNIWLMYILAVWLPVTVLYFFALPSARDYENILRLQRKQLLAAERAREANPPLIGTVTTEKEGLELSAADLDSEESLVRIKPRRATWTEFFHNTLTLDMILMAMWFCAMMCFYAYFPTVVRRAIGPEISDFVGWFMPTQALWALFVGVLCDACRTCYVMMGMNACLLIVFLVSLAHATVWPQYITAVIFIVSQAAIFEVKFTFVSEMFDPYHYGKLVGLLGVVGGIGTFINLPISNTVHYSTVFIVYSCLMPVLAAVAGYLVWRQKHGVTYKQMPELANAEKDEEDSDDVELEGPTPSVIGSPSPGTVTTNGL